MTAGGGPACTGGTGIGAPAAIGGPAGALVGTLTGAGRGSMFFERGATAMRSSGGVVYKGHVLCLHLAFPPSSWFVPGPAWRTLHDSGCGLPPLFTCSI